MHLPAASPPLRGFLLVLLSRVTAVPALRNLLLRKVKADAGIPDLPAVGALPPQAVAALPQAGGR
jgi:hypothetical protein